MQGCPVSETEFARDPFAPVAESRLVALLEGETVLPIDLVTLEEVRGGKLRQRLESRLARGVRILAVDAETDEDLESIARASLARIASHSRSASTATRPCS